MPSVEVGERVGVILSSDPEERVMKVLGEGKYLGERDLPHPTGFVRALFPEAETWDDLAKLVGDEHGEVPPQIKQNPCIELDNGAIVWGCEVWWGPLEQYHEQVAAVTYISDFEVRELDAREVESLTAFVETPDGDG